MSVRKESEPVLPPSPVSKASDSSAESRSSKDGTAARWRGRARLTYAAELAVLAAAGVIAYVSLTSGYERLVMCTALINVILALSLAITLETGRISLAQASLAGVGAYASGWLALNTSLGLWITLLMGAVVAGLAGALLAGLAMRLIGFYFIIATLAFSEIFGIVVSGWSSGTGGLDGLNGIPPLPDVAIGSMKLSYSSDQSLTGYFFTLLLILLAVFLLARCLTGSTRIGRRIRAVGDDDVLARSVGVRVTAWRSIAFIVASIVAGLAGGLQASLLGGASPSTYGLFPSVFVLAMVFTGGRRSLAGAVVGAILLTVIPEMLKFGTQTQLIYTGVFFLLVAFALPRGLVPSIVWLVHSRRRRIQ